MFSKDVFVPEDELEKLRSTLVHAYDKRKPFTRRIITALKDRVSARTSEETTMEHVEGDKKKDAA